MAYPDTERIQRLVTRSRYLLEQSAYLDEITTKTLVIAYKNLRRFQQLHEDRKDAERRYWP
jgi:hypothetical protein